MQPVLWLNVVGLTPRQARAHAPRIAALAERGALAPMDAPLPAVTCPSQATMLTGTLPSEHGIVGNGWLDPHTLEVRNWMQSNRLIEAETVYQTARQRDPNFTCAKLFWWFNQRAPVDWSVTPKPWYHADGKKSFDIYTQPAELGAELKSEIGEFPFFQFWGPNSGLGSSRWIADSARVTLRTKRPSLTMVYLPHLDYAHQRFGPDDPRSIAAVQEVDVLVGQLLDVADEIGVATLITSEYGIEAVDRPVHVNRALREAGLLAVREGPQGELLDVFGSQAFAVAEHQMAHVYVDDAADEAATRSVLEALPGVERVLDRSEQEAIGLAHERSGQLVAIAEAGAWFTYYYWLDDRRAPDFARTIDIHRKNGFDPCELFVDPQLMLPKVRVARRLAQKILGFRYTLDVIPLDASLVGGSPGRAAKSPEHGPIFASTRPFGTQPGQAGAEPDGTLPMTSVKERVLQLLADR